VAAFVLLVLFWGSAFSAIKIGLSDAPPVLFAGMRGVIGGAVVALIALVWGGRPDLRRNWPVYVWLALFNVVLFLGLQTVAIAYLPSGTAAVLIYLQPILTGFLSWPLLGEPLGPAKLAGLLLGFCGIVAVSVGGFSGAASATGIAFAASAAVAWSLGTVYFKKTQERVPMLWAIALSFLAGGVVLSAVGVFVESPPDVSWNGSFVASLSYTAVVGTALAWVLWLGLVRAGEASRVAAYVFFVPLVGIVIGAVVLDEPLSLSLLLGAALVVSGIYLVNRAPRATSEPNKPKDRRPLNRSAGCERMSPQAGKRRNVQEQQQARPPVPPFTEETARQKVKMAQDAWNTRDPEKVSLAYTEDSEWRNRDELFRGREEIVAFLERKWARELDYRLMKELWCYQGNRISVRFEYESRDESEQWWRSHGNEHWEFDESGLMKRRDASINDYRIEESERGIF